MSGVKRSANKTETTRGMPLPHGQTPPLPASGSARSLPAALCIGFARIAAAPTMNDEPLVAVFDGRRRVMVAPAWSPRDRPAISVPQFSPSKTQGFWNVPSQEAANKGEVASHIR